MAASEMKFAFGAKWDGRTFAAAATFADRAESMARLQKSLAGRRLRRARRALQLAPRPAPSQLRRRLGASPRERRINQEANQN